MPAKHILVVDDDPPIREWISEVLQEAGYQVSCASDGRDALARLDEVRPDAMILDLMMPHVDGFGVLASLREQHHLLPVIVLTASHMAGYRAAQAFHPAACGVKPIEEDWLLARLQAHLGA